MKKLHSILAMLMIIAFALNFTSCSSDDEEGGDINYSYIYGIWEPIYSEGYNIYEGERNSWSYEVNIETMYEDPENDIEYGRAEFKSDGTVWTYNYRGNGEWEKNDDYDYFEIKGNKLIEKEADNSYAATRTIVSLTADRMIIEMYYKESDWELYEKVTSKKVK